MRNYTHAIDMVEPQPLLIEDVDVDGLRLLARPPRDGRDVMLLVTEEPLCGLLLELAHRSGYEAFACDTPLDVVDTLVELGERVACAIVSATATWGEGLGEFLADEYPHVERILIES